MVHINALCIMFSNLSSRYSRCSRHYKMDHSSTFIEAMFEVDHKTTFTVDKVHCVHSDSSDVVNLMI